MTETPAAAGEATADNGYRFPNTATPAGSSAYYSIRFGARQGRPELALLFAWRAAILRIQRESRDPGVARLKLDWWRRELEASQQGQARHPLARSLSTPMALHQLPLEPFLRLLDAVEADILLQPCSDDPALEAYCRKAGGGFAELLTRVAGKPHSAALEQARQLGSFVQWVTVITELGADLRRNHCRLPQDRLARHGLAAADLAVTARPPALTPLLGEMAQRARRHYPQPSPGTSALGPAASLAALSLATLNETQRADFPVLEGQIQLTPLRKLWIAWRGGRQFQT